MKKVFGTGPRLELLSQNSKTIKSYDYGYLSTILHLSPAKSSGYEVCKWRTKECSKYCLNYSGFSLIYRSVIESRIRKTKLFFEKRDIFFAKLIKDIIKCIEYCNRTGLKLSVRLNGTSDIQWESIPVTHDGRQHDSIFDAFPNVQFYDYTKGLSRRVDNIVRPIKNYDLTYSRSEINEKHIIGLLKEGYRVSVVFNGVFPETWNGFRVIDGDKNDLRFMEPGGVVVGLGPKGRLKNSGSKFIADDFNDDRFSLKVM